MKRQVDVHVRKVRAKYRRRIPNGVRKIDVPAEVFALCGAWVPKRDAVSEAAGPKRAERVTCPSCIGARAQGGQP